MDEMFTIDNDAKADWAVCKIREAQEERDRLLALVEEKRTELKERCEAINAKYESETSGLLSMLQSYMETVPRRKTKTKESYQLLSGKLVKKAGQPKCSYDDNALLEWLKNNRPEFVITKESAAWGALKKQLDIDPETGVVTISETGEVVDVITAERGEERFEVKF